MTTMGRPRLHVDFNEMLDSDLVPLSRSDVKRDAEGALIELWECLPIEIFSDDVDDAGTSDELVAQGVVEQNHSRSRWAKEVKWCCRIGPDGIRHRSELKD
jgi:hypothetical protein